MDVTVQTVLVLCNELNIELRRRVSTIHVKDRVVVNIAGQVRVKLSTYLTRLYKSVYVFQRLFLWWMRLATVEYKKFRYIPQTIKMHTRSSFLQNKINLYFEFKQQHNKNKMQNLNLMYL